MESTSATRTKKAALMIGQLGENFEPPSNLRGHISNDLLVDSTREKRSNKIKQTLLQDILAETQIKAFA